MHWRTTRWKDWDAKCSCGNTKPRCQRNPHWRRKLAAHGNCWNNKRNRAGCHGRLGDKTLASVCGRRAGNWSGERRGASSGTKPERNARRRAADGSHPLLRPSPCKLVTSVRFEKRNGRRREGDRDDGQPEHAKQTARWSRRVSSKLIESPLSEHFYPVVQMII